MDIRQLRYFIKVIEQGSISGASKSLNISQPALSKSLRLLETNYNVNLLERSSKGIRPTEFGESLYTHAKSIDAELNRAKHDLEALSGTKKGVLSVGVLPSQAVGIMPKATVRFIQSNPRVRIKIVEKPRVDLKPALLRGEFEFVVSIIELEVEPGIEQRVLFYDKPSIIVRSDHPVISFKRFTPKRLLKFNWILPRTEADHRIHMEKYFKSFNSQLPKPVIESQSVPYTKAVVMNSDSIGILPNDIPSVEERSGLIKRLDLGGSPPARAIGILFRSDHPLSAPSRLLVAEIQNAISTTANL